MNIKIISMVKISVNANTYKIISIIFRRGKNVINGHCTNIILIERL